MGEPGRSGGVQLDEKGLAHCTRGSGKASGRAGTAGHARTRAGDARGPRYAASQDLGVRNARGTVGALVSGEGEERTEGLAGASSAVCAREQGARLGGQWVLHWHSNGHAGGIFGIVQKGTRRQGERACGRRRMRAPDTTLSPRLRASARFPFPGRRPIATAAAARRVLLAARRNAADGGRRGKETPGGSRVAATATDGRESPRTDFSGRTGASGGDLTGWCSKRRSIFAPVPAALNLPACPPRLPGAPNPLGRNLPCTTPSLPGYHPDTPTPTPPSVRLPRTMPCCGTPRVRVLECPPLGRPSPIKSVLVKMTNHLAGGPPAKPSWG